LYSHESSDTQRDSLINSLSNLTQEIFAHRQLKGDRGATGVNNHTFQNCYDVCECLDTSKAGSEQVMTSNTQLSLS
jgi:hypothetical protein